MGDLAGKRVFVTGATGFIGRRVLHLLAEQSADVCAASRSHTGRKWLADQGVTPINADISNPDQMRSVLSDSDCLVHLAYDIRAPGPVNLAAFDTVLQSAQAAGLRQMVHVSSVVVYDDWPCGDISESSPSTDTGSGYRRAKIAMEQAALAQTDLPVAILQPTLVYGPGSSLWTTRFARALMGGGIVLPTDAATAHLVYVDDVARAIVAALSGGKPANGRYLISGAGDATWSDYLGGMAKVLETPWPQIEPAEDLVARAGPRPDPNAPPSAPSIAARVSAVGRRLVGHERFEKWVAMLSSRSAQQGQPLYPDHVLLDLFQTIATVHIDKAAADLGYVPTFDLPKGMAATTSFLQELRQKG